MRAAHASLILSAVLALVPLASQAPGRAQDPVAPPEKQGEKPKGAGLGGYLDSEHQRLVESMDGVWLLVRFDPPHSLFDSNNVQGVLMVRDGYLSLNVMMQQVQKQLFGNSLQLLVQGGAHRYRINDLGRLQTSAIMGYHNFEQDGGFVVEGSGSGREYSVSLDEAGDTLRLTRADGAVMTWIRLHETEFPEETIEALTRPAGEDY